MTQSDSIIGLSPVPHDLVPIVLGLVQGTWPKTEVEREALFDALGFVSGAAIVTDDQDSPHRMTSLDLGLSGKISSTWDTYSQEFLSVCTFLYSSRNPQDPVTRSGFDALQAELSELYGAPERPWEDEDQSIRIWRCNGRSITMQLFDRRDSTVMLTVEDLVLASVIDSEEAAH